MALFSGSSESATQERRLTAQIVAIVTATFACYLAIGMPLATLPTYVHLRLGYGTVLAGLAISVQYVATLLTRPRAGRMADTRGGKAAALTGLVGCGASGLLLVAAAMLARWPGLSLIVLAASRLTLGFGESCVATGAIAWGIGRVGSENTAQVISWNGIATYGAIAIGAPLGAVVERWGGFTAVGWVTVGLGVAGWLFATSRKPAAVIAGKRLPFGNVLSKILSYGIGLALGSAGFGAIAAFVTLFYASRHWPDAAGALTCFGFCFVGSRLVFARTINRYGGFRVALVSFGVEALGLLLLAWAGSPATALAAAALAGGGFALVFPALGVEAVARVSAPNRGAALGAYSAFLDLALGATGPIAGALVNGYGYPTAFEGVALAAGVGALLTVALWRRANTSSDPAVRNSDRVRVTLSGAEG